MVKPKRIGHLVLGVRDVAASEAFYTEVLGFQVATKMEIGTFLTCGKIHHDLALVQAPEDAEPASRDLGLRHFAVQVEDIDELKEVHERLQACGAKIDRLIDHGMTKSVYFRDPDGNHVEFFFNTTETSEEGLAVMRDPSIRAKDFVFDDAS